MRTQRVHLVGMSFMTIASKCGWQRNWNPKCLFVEFFQSFHTFCSLTLDCSSTTCPQCRRPIKSTDLRRLYLNVNLNTVSNATTQWKECERTISSLRQLNRELINENEEMDTKFKDKVKEHSWVASFTFTILWLFTILQVSYLEMQMEKTNAEKDKLTEAFQCIITNLELSLDAQLVKMFVLISISNGVNVILL